MASPLLWCFRAVWLQAAVAALALCVVVIFLGCCQVAFGQADGEPVLRLEADGPTSYVTSLAFSPDGQTLYAGSWDKTVYVWKWNAVASDYQLDPLATLRVPIGPGLDGAINTIAVSPDGDWVAAAGTSPMRGAADFRQPGQIIPTIGGLTSEMRQDAGTIYVFNTRTGQTHSLRGHQGEVRALTFAASAAATPLLVSAAREWNESAGRHEGIVRVWPSLEPEMRPLVQVLPVPGGENAIWSTWPKLAARRTGQEPTAIEVGIAWGDGIFRVWDVARNQLLAAPRQGPIQDVVAVHGTSGQFFSGAFGEDESFRLRAWRPRQGAGLEIDQANSVEQQSVSGYRIIPRGLAFASSAAGNRSDVLCAVVHRNVMQDQTRDQYELWLYPSSPRTTAPRMTFLWLTGPPPRRSPQMATSAGGEYLAISRESEIYVYPIANLLAGNARPKILRSAGAALEEVAFVRQRGGAENALGLRLSGPARGGTGSAANRPQYVFDLTHGKLEPLAANAGWTAAPAPAGNWRIDRQATAAGAQPAGSQLLITQGGQRRGTIGLPAPADRSVYALAASAQPPVVALATYDNGLPTLALYDAASGRQFRQLTSHSARIRSLAFSDDGQLLASVADDDTICVWGLRDLDRIVGKRGKAPGIAVQQTEGGLSVKLDEPVTFRGLQNGDLLTARVTAGGKQPWTSAREFYDAFWSAAPGASVRVSRRQPAGGEEEVAIPVAQGSDERKPLFTLFVASGPEGRLQNWIAWSPLGPYQSSDGDVERYLGWHFNTGRPESPVAFAGAAQYREKYFRPGLIDALLKTGQPPEAAQARRPLPRPVAEFVIEGGELVQGKNGGEVLLRKPPEKASLVVDNLAADQIERIEMSLGDKPLGSLEPQDDGATWSIGLDPADWRPGEYIAKAVVHTREAVPQQHAIERRLRFQTPSPQVEIEMAPAAISGLHLAERSLPFSASVQPGTANEPTEVVLKKIEGNSETELKRWTTTEPLKINENIELAEGGSQLVLVARNVNALPGHEVQETERKQLAVNRQPAPPPVLATAQVEELAEGEGGEVLDVGNGPRKVTVDRIRLLGDFVGAREQLAIESDAGSAAALHITPAGEGKPARYSSDEIKLQPGLQRISLKRQQFGGPPITTTIELDYRPPLPELAIDEPQEPELALVAGRDAAVLNLAARLMGPAPDPTLEAAILINGQPSGTAPTVDLNGQKITAQIPLSDGESLVELKLWDAWNEPRVERLATVRYLKLPTIERVEIKNDRLPLLELALSGQSATPVTRVEVGETVLLPSAIQFDATSGRWQSTAHVQRQPTAQELTVQVHNRDGSALVPAKAQIPAWRQLQPPPVIELSRGGNVTTADFELRFTVRSSTQIRSVNVKHNRTPVAFDFRLTDLKPEPSGEYLLTATVPVQLASGDNRFDVLAANDGGADAQQSLVNYIDPPARIVIDRVETVGGPQKIEVPIVVDSRRAFANGSAPTGKVLIYGQVKWPLSTDKTYLKRKQRLQLWVNGFQQAPGVLEQPTAGNPTSKFTAFAVLNKKEDNKVQLALPDLTTDIATLLEFHVACEQPIVEQRLHVLIVGVGAPPGSEPELEQRVLTALQAKRLNDEQWESAAFSRIVAYGPLVGNNITPQQVRGQLSDIKLKIDELYQRNRAPNSRPANDVVMIYLQGGSLINVGDSFYVTTRPASDPRTKRAVSQLEPRILLDVAVQSRTLANFLTHTTGAHVLMLDVTGNLNTDDSAEWPEDSRAAMLRYTWLKSTQAPAQARLLAALPEAIQNSSSLAQLDLQFAEYNRALKSQFPESTVYNRRVPDMLQSLLLGKSP